MMLLYLLLTFSFLGLFASEDTPKCQDGPKVWCEDFSNAVQCNAENHCINLVWNTLPPPKLNDSILCKPCVSAIDSIRYAMGHNVTQEVVEEILEHVCDLTLATELVYKKCAQMVDRYVGDHIVDLMKLIASGADSTVICHDVLHLCFNSQTASEIDAKPQELVSATTTTTRHLLGSKRCTWGPSYWCKNIHTSSECKVTNHCANKVWINQEFPEDNDNVCQVCEDMVKQARDTLLSNQTQEELKEVLEGSCKLIPIKPISKECCRLADDFIPELTEMLVSQMNPVAVCTTAGLCNNPSIDRQLLEMKELKEGDQEVEVIKDVIPSECACCHDAMNMLKKGMPIDVEKAIEFVNPFCAELSSYSEICSAFVKTYLPIVYEPYLLNFKPYQACHLTGMCYKRFHYHPSEITQGECDLAKTSDNLPCDFCKQIVAHVKNVLVANTTEEEFHQVLVGVCKQTGKFAEKCLTLVNENFAVIYQFITKELDGGILCESVGICPINRTILTVEYPQINGDLNSGQVAILSNTKLTTDSPKCEFCKYIVHFIQEQMSDPRTEEDIKNAVEQVCHAVPKRIKQKCTQFIDDYADLIIAILSEEADPALICPELRLCPLPPTKPAKASSCPFCLLAVKELIETVKKGPSEEAIKRALEGLCAHMPREMRKECDDFVANNYEALINMIVAEFTPEEICVYLKLCKPTPTLSFLVDVQTTETNEIAGSDTAATTRPPVTKSCTVCRALSHHFINPQAHTMTELSFGSYLFEECKHVAEEWRRDCRQFAKKRSNMFLALLESGTPALDLCPTLKICPAEKRFNGKSQKCFTCEAIAESAANSKNDLIVHADAICSMYPARYNKECLVIVRDLSAVMDNLEGKRLPPDACHLIGVCSSIAQESTLFCEAGPDYWCASTANAARCNAVDYCQKLWWKKDKRTKRNGGL